VKSKDFDAPLGYGFDMPGFRHFHAFVGARAA
jgi:hypothetical protein